MIPVKPLSDEAFARVWNDVDNFPTVRAVANYAGKTYEATRHQARRLRDQPGSALINRSGTGGGQALIPEMRATYIPGMTAAQLITRLRDLQADLDETHITRTRFRNVTGISDSTWNRYFGTFLEFRRQAGLELSRSQHGLERQIAKHVAADTYRTLNDRMDLGDKYDRRHNKKIRTMIVASDLHDHEVDPFYLRTLLAAIRMVQPDTVVLGGDILDLPEFGRFATDPREWDAVGRIQFAQKHIFAPIREAAGDAQIDYIEGNHEYRLLRHLADQTPALKVVLSDLLGLTVSKIFGLDEHEINYVAKADLAAFNKADQRKQVEKSYKVYDDAFLFHHHPHARNWGLPGANGHHHSWKVFHMKNALNGAYQWLQLGCGHRLRASYCEGEFWSMGFNIAHINTETKAVNHEYVNVTDMAVVGGLYLHRQPDEMIGEFARRDI
ncbi:MAG TPA: hypothetical protein VIG24_12005 [Acidimicrobiia bacterium]